MVSQQSKLPEVQNKDPFLALINNSIQKAKELYIQWPFGTNLMYSSWLGLYSGKIHYTEGGRGGNPHPKMDFTGSFANVLQIFP